VKYQAVDGWNPHCGRWNSRVWCRWNTSCGTDEIPPCGTTKYLNAVSAKYLHAIMEINSCVQARSVMWYQWNPRVELAKFLLVVPVKSRRAYREIPNCVQLKFRHVDLGDSSMCTDEIRIVDQRNTSLYTCSGLCNTECHRMSTNVYPNVDRMFSGMSEWVQA